MKTNLLSTIIALAFVTVATGTEPLRWPASENSTPPVFDSIHLANGTLSLALRFTPPGSEWTGTLFSRRAKQGEPSLSVTAFRHEPFGKRYLGVAMDGVVDGPSQAAAMTVRDSVIGGHLVGAFTELDANLDSGEHRLVFRCDGETAELFIDGVRRESRSVERFTARTFLKLFPHHAIGWQRGCDPGGADRFTGQIGEVRLWNRALSNDEVQAESGGVLETPALAKRPLKGFAAELFPAEWNDEQRMQAVDNSLPRWLAERLTADPWFPRFHVALPAGMMFDTRCANFGGRYHLFPTWRPDLNLTRGLPGAFRMQHLSSSDLVHWRIEPVPLRFPDRDVCNGSPAIVDRGRQFFFLRYDATGAPHRAVPKDDTLAAWTLPEPQPKIVQEGPGYSGRLDSVVFQHGGRYYLTGTRRNTHKPSMAMPLYRSDDLTNWSYLGDFYQTNTKPFNECPQIFEVDGKMVVAAFYPLHEHDENYLVGRFQDERFVREWGGRWDYGGHAHNRSFDAEPTHDGRVIGWSTISVYADADAIDVARQGWKGIHSLPKEVSLGTDNVLALQPAKELSQLRLGGPSKTLPGDHHGQFELQLSLNAAAKLVFATPDGECALHFDPRTRILSFDQTRSPKLGGDHGHIFRTPPLPSGKVRLFFDRSVFEVFADGYVLTSRYFSREPEKMTVAGLPSGTNCWKLGTIWATPH